MTDVDPHPAPESDERSRSGSADERESGPSRSSRASTGRTQVLRRIPWLIVLLTSLAVAVYFPLQYAFSSLATLGASNIGLARTYADRPLPVQVAFYVHIGFAGVALLVGGLQFSRRLRRRSRTAHRWVGRTYVVSVLVGGSAAFVMSFFSSVAFSGFFGFGTLAVLWVWTTYRGYRSARRRDLASHQAWMIRSYALTYAAPSLRLWLFILIAAQIFTGNAGPDVLTYAYAPVPFLCWIPNIVIDELVIRRRGLPGLRFEVSEARRTRHDLESSTREGSRQSVADLV